MQERQLAIYCHVEYINSLGRQAGGRYRTGTGSRSVAYIESQIRRS